MSKMWFLAAFGALSMTMVACGDGGNNNNDEICNNGADDDGDGARDCQDDDCAADPACQGGDGTSCDADGDCPGGACLDEANAGFPAGYCTGECEDDADCNGGICSAAALCLVGCDALGDVCGDVSNGAYTCQDFAGDLVCLPACDDNADCAETGFCNIDQGICAFQEVCDNGVDDDGDNAFDCEDGADCQADPACQQQIADACAGAVALTQNGNAVDLFNDDNIDGTALFVASCQLIFARNGAAGEDIFTFVAAADATITVTLVSDTDMGVYSRSDCADVATETGCADLTFPGAGDGNETTETLNLNVVAGESVTFFVDAFDPGQEGPYTLTIQ